MFSADIGNERYYFLVLLLADFMGISDDYDDKSHSCNAQQPGDRFGKLKKKEQYSERCRQRQGATEFAVHIDNLMAYRLPCQSQSGYCRENMTVAHRERCFIAMPRITPASAMDSRFRGNDKQLSRKSKGVRSDRIKPPTEINRGFLI